MAESELPELPPILRYLSEEERAEIVAELERAGPRGEAPDLDAMQCQVLKELLLWNRRPSNEEASTDRASIRIAALEEAAKACEPTLSTLLLVVGEMTIQEQQSVRAALVFVAAAIRGLAAGGGKAT